VKVSNYVIPAYTTIDSVFTVNSSSSHAKKKAYSFQERPSIDDRAMKQMIMPRQIGTGLDRSQNRGVLVSMHSVAICRFCQYSNALTHIEPFVKRLSDEMVG